MNRPDAPAAAAVIRDYRPGDEAAINRAFNRTFGVDRDLAEWEWKFPHGGGREHIVLAVAAGEVLAHFAAEPVTVQVDGRPVAAGHAVDAFARPGGGLARRGLYVRAVERFYAVHGGEGGLRFLYGFPGGRHLALGRRLLGYEAPLPVAFFRRRGLGAVGSAVPRRSLVDLLSRRAVVAEVNLAADDLLWARAAHRYPVAVVRDGARLQRRFGGRPGVTYHRRTVWRRGEPRASGVFRVDGRLLRWTELVWDGASRRDLVALDLALAAAGGAFGAESGELWLGGDPRAAEILASQGWRRERHPEDLHLTAVALGGVEGGGGEGGGGATVRLDIGALVPRFYTTLGDSDLA